LRTEPQAWSFAGVALAPGCWRGVSLNRWAPAEALISALRGRASHPSQWMLAELIAYSGARPQDALALSYGRIGTRRIV
jgi:hypothetical protein